MNHFVERLPGRIAALAGLLVGAVSGWVGVDLWQCLLRMAIAFVFFYVLGLGLRNIMLQSKYPLNSQHRDSGRHLDKVTPEMTVDDLHVSQTEPLPQRGDDSET